MAPRNAKPPGIRFLFWLRSAIAPTIGRTMTWMTVAAESR
jgi:hypothetical protein